MPQQALYMEQVHPVTDRLRSECPTERMGIASDARDGFQAGQYLRHPAGAEAEQPIIGLMLIEVLLEKVLGKFPKTHLPLSSTLTPHTVMELSPRSMPLTLTLESSDSRRPVSASRETRSWSRRFSQAARSTGIAVNGTA